MKSGFPWCSINIYDIPWNQGSRDIPLTYITSHEIRVPVIFHWHTSHPMKSGFLWCSIDIYYIPWNQGSHDVPLTYMTSHKIRALVMFHWHTSHPVKSGFPWCSCDIYYIPWNQVCSHESPYPVKLNYPPWMDFVLFLWVFIPCWIKPPMNVLPCVQ